MKRKFGQAALDAIDASLNEADAMWHSSPGMDQACRELRAIRRVIVACGGAVFIRGTGQPLVMDIDSRVRIEKAILNAREVEARRKRNA